LLGQIRLKLDPAVSYLPAIAITSYSREYGADAALSAGFDRFLTKPINAEPLVEAILQLVE
jgi:CheY-like chemotaxis protein